jgi:hypothetical protein
VVPYKCPYECPIDIRDLLEDERQIGRETLTTHTAEARANCGAFFGATWMCLDD